MQGFLKTFEHVPFPGESDNLLFRFSSTEEVRPDFRTLLSGFKSRRSKLFFIPRQVILRDFDHCASWLAWFTDLQIELYKPDVENLGKKMDIVIVSSKDLSQLDVLFRLSTIGFPGYTQYRIQVRKLDEDRFACYEPPC